MANYWLCRYSSVPSSCKALTVFGQNRDLLDVSGEDLLYVSGEDLVPRCIIGDAESTSGAEAVAADLLRNSSNTTVNTVRVKLVILAA